MNSSFYCGFKSQKLGRRRLTGIACLSIPRGSEHFSGQLTAKRNVRSYRGFKTQKSWLRRLSGVGQCSGRQKSEPLQNALLHNRRNMNRGFAQSSQEKSRIFAAQELHIENRGRLQEVSTVVIYMAAIDRCASRPRLVGHAKKRCAWSRQDRETARPGHCRLTSRCSGPGPIKCTAAGEWCRRPGGRRAPACRQGRRAAAELGR